MGGIPVNTNGQVRSGPNDLIDGFFAAGESAVSQYMEQIDWE